MNVLVVKEGPLAGQRLDLRDELVIGRENAGLTIDDEELSRRHAVLRSSDGSVEIEDLGSRNGTFVNGGRIEAVTRLLGGDTVKVGRTVFELEAPRAASTVASPVPVAVAAVAVPGPGLEPSAPFGAYAAPAGMRSRRGIASRQLVPMLLSWAVVVATAVALIVYFAVR
jgi:pSer/pThr/pTyr-binding forkhead associated (FHA) protein